MKSKNSAIRLSICIPTYNRKDFLEVTLKSLELQMRPDVEIIIHDNGSIDNTEEMVLQYQQKHSCIFFEKFLENQGADRNFLRVIERAKGEYCWFLGSDDILEKGAVDTVMTALEYFSNLTGLSVNRNVYDRNLEKILSERPLDHLLENRLFTSSKECLDCLCLYFGYLSGQIIKRSLWNEIIKQENISSYYNSYIHVYMIGKMVLKNPRWAYLHDKCVGWRSGHDSFLSEGYLKRFAIDAIGYEEIIRGLVGVAHPSYRRIIEKIGKVHLTGHVKAAKLKGRERGFSRKAFLICFKRYWMFSFFWWRLVPLLITPAFLLKALKICWYKRLSTKP